MTKNESEICVKAFKLQGIAAESNLRLPLCPDDPFEIVLEDKELKGGKLRLQNYWNAVYFLQGFTYAKMP